MFESCSAVKRAILTSYGHLTSLGYELLKVTEVLPHFEKIFQLAIKLYLNMDLLRNKDLLDQ